MSERRITHTEDGRIDEIVAEGLVHLEHLHDMGEGAYYLGVETEEGMLKFNISLNEENLVSVTDLGSNQS